MNEEKIIMNNTNYSEENEYILKCTMKIKTPNNRCKDEVSKKETSGNYEARMQVYLEEYENGVKTDIESFFNDFNLTNIYTFDKENLIQYMNTFKFEFEFEIINKYNNISLEYWENQMCKIESLSYNELKFNIDKHDIDSQKRYYISSKDKIFSSLKGYILLPEISSIHIQKYKHKYEDEYKYIFKLEVEDNYKKKVELINKIISKINNNKLKVNNIDNLVINTNSVINFENEFKIKSLYYENKIIIEKQISKALSAGKNIILVGPPGTGKSKLAKQICEHYNAKYNMTTAISDWSTYETIGGYKLDKDSSLYFDPGIFLTCFKDSKNQVKNEWLIIDEMNRADIDKAFGTFFSTLAGDSVNLSFKDNLGKNIEIINEKDMLDIKSAQSNQYIIPSDWRLIGSINTFDKTSLFEMSYAFMRRFAFIPISVPKNINVTTLEEYLKCWQIDNVQIGTSFLANGLKDIWVSINKYRSIGPAIIRDIAKYVECKDDWVSAIILYVLPQFEGIEENKIKEFIEELFKNNIGGLESEKNIISDFIEDFFGIYL